MKKARLASILCICLLLWPLSGCDGPAEEAGEKLDQMVEQQRQKIEAAEKQIAEAREEIEQLRRDLAQARTERQEAEEKLTQARQERRQALDEMEKIVQEHEDNGSKQGEGGHQQQVQKPGQLDPQQGSGSQAP